MRRRHFIPLLAVVALRGASRSEYLSAKRKFDDIEKRKVRPGTRVTLHEPELNAYAQAELPNYAPPGVRSPRVELLGNNMATGYALIDFVKLRSAQGKPPGWMLRKLLEGEHEVSVTIELKSANSTATIYLKSVEIAGIPISGSALDFLIDNYLLPNYPTAKIARPIQLKYGMDHFEVMPDRVDVVMKR